MELIFLDKDDLKVLDYGYVEKEFTIVIDSVIPQKSNFNVNSININAEVGDLLVVKDPEVNYIGIITSILNQVLSRSGREEQATMTTLAALIVVLMISFEE